MKRRQKRLAIVLGGLVALGGATAMVLAAFSDNLVFFYSPSELAARSQGAGQRIRIGGLVETGSFKHGDGRHVSFKVTDGKTDLAVNYDGVLPDLFREGQGVVVEGRLGNDGVFAASNVLAKHDEKYMPREVVDALKKSGRWQEGGSTDALAAPPPASR